MMTPFVAAALIGAQPTAGEFKVVGASMFKNGYAVLIREFDVARSGTLEFANPPTGTLGTVWVSADRGVKVLSLKSSRSESKALVDAPGFDAILQRNLGKQLEFVLTGPKPGEPLVIEATLRSASNESIVLSHEGRTRVVPRPWLLSISGPEGTFETKVESTTVTPVLRIGVEGKGKGYLMTLERGLTWAPAYSADITDEKKLRLSAKATILNDVANLEAAELRLITGFPHIRFLGVPDPLTSTYSVDQFVNGIAQAGTAGMPAPAPMLGQNFQMAGRLMERDAAFDNSAWSAPNLEGFAAGDLFFYEAPSLSLAVGERAVIPLFEATTDYAHVYTLVAEDSQAMFERLPPNQEAPPLDVWHELEFTNTTGQPFTTAAAITVAKNQVLGQDMLNYTSPGAKARLKVTKAMDIRADQNEVEVAREQGALRPRDGSVWDLVTVNGVIRVTNRKREDVELRATKFVVGTVDQANLGGEIEKEVRGLRAVNATSTVDWRRNMKPGEEIELSYTYRTYVRV